MRKVVYETVSRPKKDAAGEQKVGVAFMKDGELGKPTPLGTIKRDYGVQDYRAHLLDGTHLGTFDTRSQAGEALKKFHDNDSKDAGATEATDETATATPADTEGTPAEAALDDVLGGRLLTIAEAAEELCGGASNPVSALKKRIRRGSVKTRDVAGDTFVVLPNTEV